MASVDRLEKLKQVLHPLSEKRVQMICTATNNPLFFISNANQNPHDPSQHEEGSTHFVSVEEFRYVYLKN